LFFIVALLEKMIQRALQFSDALFYEMEVNSGGFYGGMSQKMFDGIYICAVGQQVGGKGVS